jgi:hypothetical protein
LNLLAIFGGNTGFDLHDLLDLVAADFFNLAGIQKAHIYAAFGHFVAHNVVDLCDLKVAVAKEGDFFVFQLYGGR